MLAILVLPLAAGQPSVRAATSPSDWPSLNADAAQSNANPVEKTLTSRNVLKLKVRWVQPLPDVSYPVVASGRVYLPTLSKGVVHVRAVAVSTGKQLSTYPRDAFGGLLVTDGNLYLAGKAIQEVDPSTGDKLAQINASPKAKNATFVYPVADHKLLVAGYVSTRQFMAGSLYAIDPQSNQVRWKLPSLTGQGEIGMGRILTRTSAGTDFYDETSGKRIGRQSQVFGDWFAGPVLAYTVSSVKRGKATLYAVDGTGHTLWKHAVGPYSITSDWPHAVDDTGVYVRTLKPRDGLEAFDPDTGKLLWSRAIPNVQRLALANGVVFALSAGLGLPVRLTALRADTGTVIGNRAITLSSGYSAFNAPNGLMVANGIVFIRAVGPKGSQLVALGL